MEELLAVGQKRLQAVEGAVREMRQLPVNDSDAGSRDCDKNARADFSCLYEDNYKRIFNYLLYGCGDIETAMDLTSETFFKALRAWPAFEQRGVPPSAWLFKIASRELAMHFRRQGRLKRWAAPAEFSDENEGVRRQVIDEEVFVAKRELESREDFIVLSPLIKKLPKKYREVVFLRFFAGLSIEDVAGSLGRPTGTVKAQLHRALKRLRTELQPSGADEHLINQEMDSTAGMTISHEEVD